MKINNSHLTNPFRKKTTLLKTLVICLIVLALEITAGYLLYISSTKTSQETAYHIYQDRIQQVGQHMSNTLDATIEELQNDSTYQLECNFQGELSEGNRNLSLSKDGATYNFTLTDSTLYQSYTRRNVHFIKIDRMLNQQQVTELGIENATYLIYSISQGAGQPLKMYFVDLEEWLKQFIYDFNEIIIVYTNGEIIDVNSVIGFTDNVDNFGINRNDLSDGLSSVVKIGDQRYLASSTTIANGLSYYIIGLVDFVGVVQISYQLALNTIIICIIVSLGVFGCLFYYFVTAHPDEHSPLFDYRLSVDYRGEILRANPKFKKDFPGTHYLTEEITEYPEKEFNMLDFASSKGRVPMAMIVKKAIGQKVNVRMTKLNVRAEADDKGDSMHDQFNRFQERGGRVLIGKFRIGNLRNLQAIFGNMFADAVYNVVFGRIVEEFNYVYPTDGTDISILFPDEGKNLDIRVQEMRDIMTRIGQPVQVDNNLVTTGVFAGFAVCDATMQVYNFNYAQTACDAAFKRTQEEQIQNYFIYHESQKKLYAKYFINFDILKMMKENAFEMEYQPQYNVHTNKIAGFEALFRVKRSWNQTINTFDIITYAERTGNMVQLGEFIFDTAMQFAKKVEPKGVHVSLNVSPVQLMQAGFTDNFLKLYNKYDFKPGTISIEITESYLMTNFDETIQKLNILRSKGISVHLDDFGTLYSSLLYLKKMPANVLKVDREFVMDISKSSYSHNITGMIIAIAKELKCESIIEGVETVAQYETVIKLGADMIQGWLIGKSMKDDKAIEFIDTFNIQDALNAAKAKGENT